MVVLALCALLTGVILKGLTLQTFEFDVCVCMSCVGIGFVDRLKKGFIYIYMRGSFIIIMTKFGCPGVALCS